VNVLSLYAGVPDTLLSEAVSKLSGSFPHHSVMKINHVFFVLIAAAMLLFPAAHSREADHERAREALSQGEIHSLSDMLAAISPQFPGEIIEVKLHRRKKEEDWIYEFKILDSEGILKKIEVDAATREILKIKGKPEKPHARPHR